MTIEANAGRAPTGCSRLAGIVAAAAVVLRRKPRRRLYPARRPCLRSGLVQTCAALALVAAHAAAAQARAVDEVTPVVPPGVDDPRDDSRFDGRDGLLARPGRPSIVVIMLDDLDVRSLDDLLRAGLMPNLQSRIIDRGVELAEAYVSTPLCCPSRATFLTGQYPHNTGIVTNMLLNPGAGLQWAISRFDDSVTIGTRLEALGYTTAHVGKYLNGYGSDASLAALSPAFDPAYVPPGWSYWRGLIDFRTYCVYDYTINANGVLTHYMLPAGQTESSALYQTNVLADLAESFVLTHRDDAAPFYLEVMPLAPHAEQCADAYGGPPPDHDSFETRIRPAPEDAAVDVPPFVPGPAYDEDLADKPAWLAAEPLTAADLADIAQQYRQRLRAVLAADRLIGRIVAALGPRLEQTALIFTSDNGFLYGDHRAAGKIYAYTESARVPLYVALPGARERSIRSNLVLNNDLAPTIVDLAAPGYADARFDGRSLVPILREPDPPDWQDRSRFLIEYSRSNPVEDAHPTYSALRSTDRLYVESYSGVYYATEPPELIGLELYDLLADPNETNSLLHHPESERSPALGAWLDRLSTCEGTACRLYEDATDAP